MAESASAPLSTSSSPPLEVIVHPLVLLSVVDHYNRVAKDTKKRVVGVLLGEVYKGRVDITNSFAIPFDEDPKQKSIWYMDHNYLESMYHMFWKVNAKEKMVGFYSTGPRIRESDIAIASMFKRWVKQPVFVIIDVRPDCEGLPTQAYTVVETVKEGKETQETFQHVSCEVGAHEAEEIGVEHLLRDINDPSVSTLAAEIRNKLAGLRGLRDRLAQMSEYLASVIAGRMPVNHEILGNMQTILNLLPNLNAGALIKSLMAFTSDSHMVMYISALVRSIIALHDLLNNQLKYKDLEDAEEDEREASAEAQRASKAAASKSKPSLAQEEKEGPAGESKD